MTHHSWVKELPGSVVVCDLEGIIQEMNKAVKTFEADGGIKLVGSNLLDCHPEWGCREDAGFANFQAGSYLSGLAFWRCLAISC
jgi:hypothetical protein